ncbi:hypothetical protein FVA81_03365 (plasmid) [Rhizobium sp. WL3]|uniref:hypothetical protein n=1 Tax=Rhizobium sp. WL3 TaxID=2603277 RepID=UPI0011C20341|nr:hypothetical protein [Rhizobium sp. WL3]QEE43675.1 hypothetical protein FVA81_03365 [Rhizobium sp. WL3]
MSQSDLAKMSKRRVFLLCSRRPIIAEFLILADYLAKEQDLRAVLVVPDGFENLLPRELPEDCSVVLTGPRSWRTKGVKSLFAYGFFGLIRKLSSLVRRASLQILGDFLDTWEGIARGKWFARHILEVAVDSAAVLLADDRDLRADQGILAEARKSGVFTMVVAFGKSDPDADAQRRATPVFDIDLPPFRWLKQRMQRAYPASVRLDVNGRRLGFFRLGEYHALKAHAALFDAPWSYGGGRADKVALLDTASLRLLKSMGVSEQKLFISGQCSHDILWEGRKQRDAIRRRLVDKYRFPAEKPLVLLSMPPLGEHGMAATSVQRNETTFLCKAIRQATDCNVLISLHPRQSRNEYEQIAADCGFVIACEALREILVAADLFVAYSSTIGWAQMLGIPSVALEYYGLGFTLFDGEPGVIAVTDRAHLVHVCQSLLSPHGERARLVEELQALGEQVMFDGGACQRLVTALRQNLYAYRT